MTIGRKMTLIFLAIGVSVMAVTGTFSYVTAKKSLKTVAFDKLTFIRNTRKNQIEDYFKQIEEDIIELSENPTTMEAMKGFKETFHQYEDQATSTLQRLYIYDNPNPTGKKEELDHADDGGNYSWTHATYHPIFRKHLRKRGHYDIFLVDPETGHIIYSVFKELDYATSLLSGEYRNSNIADCFRAIKNIDRRDATQIVDFKAYAPSHGAPASFIASPIHYADERIGVLIFQVPVDELDAVMNERSGLGKTGETYLVGEDLLMRSDSRFETESTILRKKIDTVGVRSALAKNSKTEIFPDYRNIPVLSSYAPLEIKGLNWVLMSELDATEAFADAHSLRNKTLIGDFLILVAIMIGAIFIAKGIAKPIQELDKAVKKASDGHLDVSVSIESNDEIGSLGKNFNSMVGNILEANRKLEEEKSASEKQGKYLSDSVDEVLDGMKKLAGGDHSIRLSLGNGDEIQELSEGFNSLAEQIALATEALNLEKSEAEARQNYLSDSVGTIIEKMEAFAGGDLLVKLEVVGDDEIAQLFDGFNRSVSSIHDLIRQANQMVEATASAATQIGSSTRELAAGGQEQSSQAKSVVETVRVMTKIFAENATITGQTVTAAEVNGKVAEEGSGVVGQTVDKMRMIGGVVQGFVATINELGDASKKIGKIVSVINGIADQTNLLALNAAIEAARAGTQGRGFAVVADEVRKLAERTTQSTKEIANMIESIQGEVLQAIEAVEQGTQETMAGISLADRAGSALDQVLENTQKVVGMINKIAEASEQQTAASAEISQGVEMISTVTSQSAMGLEQIAQSTEELDQLATGLQTLMRKFNTASSTATSSQDNPLALRPQELVRR